MLKTPSPLIRAGAELGPMPTMLSNLRFNVLRSWDTKLGVLKLTVVPRAGWGVEMSRLKEASFLLPMTSGVPWDVPKGKKCITKVKITSLMRRIESDAGEYTFNYDTDVYMGVE